MVHPKWPSFAAAIAFVGLLSSHALLAQQKPEKLYVASHRVHMTVAVGTQAGDVTAAWRQRNGVGVEWLTFDTNPLHERLFRELALPETTIDVGFIVNFRAVPALANLLEPLDAYQTREPIEDFPDFFPGMVDAMRFGGKLYGIPYRHASSGMHFNEALLKERGLSGPPKSAEEFIEYARKLTYTRADGTQVHGFVIEGDNYPNIVDLARAWDGDFITSDYRIATTEKGMMNAITTLREFYKDGVLPRSFTAIKGEEVNVWMQQGRAAMTLTSMSRNRIYNDPEKSKFPGQIKTTTIPISKDFASKFQVAPAKVEFWAMVIPKNAKNKALAWSLIREMSSKDNTAKAALNGNGPVRNSTYDNADFTSKLPYAEAERAVLKVSRVPLPAFDNAAKAADIFVEEMQAAVLGMKDGKSAMQSVEDRVKPLLPK
jgi:multiple sugar transport system substrate-binding protein